MVSEHADPLAAPGAADVGGQNVHVRALAAALGARGHQVDVHTRRADPTSPAHEAAAPGVTVHRVPAGPARALPKDALLAHMPAFGAALADAWSGRRPDVVHAHFWMSGLAARPPSRDLGVPMVQTFHALGVVKRRHQGDADTSPPERVRHETDLAAAADRVLATCRDEVDELLALGAPPDRVEIVPCGVDTVAFRPAPRTAAAHRRVVVVARLVPRKGVDTALAALAELPGTELVVAGGPDGAAFDGDPEVRRLRALADALGVGGRVRLIGPVPHARVPALLATADVVACVPEYEPFGMVALEAMACGVPVVASAVGGLADTVLDGVTGRLVPPGSPAAVAAAVRELLDPALAAGTGAAGRRRVLATYGWDRVAAATASSYRRLVAADRARVPSGSVR